jgi:hypothetical protein
MGKRFAIVIGVAAAGVMTLGALGITGTAAAESSDQASTASAGVATYLTITRDGSHAYHGLVSSRARKCADGRRVVLFEQQPGPDRMLAVTRSKNWQAGEASWWKVLLQVGLQRGDPVYAKAPRTQRSGFVCRADRSWIIWAPTPDPINR